MRRLVTLVVSLALAVGAFTATAFAGNPHEWPEGFAHGHAMLIGFEMEMDGENISVSYKKCVEFKTLPNAAHHHTIHTGTAGGALFNAGNGVLPLTPLIPEFEGCDDIPNPWVFPAEEN